MSGSNGPAWIKCGSCDDYWCYIHAEHVYDCPCPSIETWAARDLDPYKEGASMDPDSMSEWEDVDD